jgi:hypothetical protein
MSPSQILFLALDGVITAILVALVLRRRRNESAASGELRTTTTTVTLGTTSTTSTAGASVAPRAALAGGSSGASLTNGTPTPGAAPESSPETGSLTRLFGRGQLRGLATFAAEQNERIGSYVRERWSGVPEQLPPVLDALLTDLERDAVAKGLLLDRETLKSMLVVALRSNRIGDSDVVLEALDKVA